MYLIGSILSVLIFVPTLVLSYMLLRMFNVIVELSTKCKFEDTLSDVGPILDSVESSCASCTSPITGANVEVPDQQQEIREEIQENIEEIKEEINYNDEGPLDSYKEEESLALLKSVINPEVIERERLYDEKIELLKKELEDKKTPPTFTEDDEYIRARLQPKPIHEYTD